MSALRAPVAAPPGPRGRTPRAPAPEPVPRRTRRVLGLRGIAAGLAVAMTAAAALTVGGLSERSARETLTQQLEARLLLEARNLALSSSPALLGDYPELTLHPLVKRMTSGRPEMALAVVVDHRGVILGHPDGRQIGAAFVPPPGLQPAVARETVEDGESLLLNDELLVAKATVRHPGGRPIGTAWVGLRRAYVEQVVASSRRQQALVLVGLTALGMACAFVLMSQLLRPMSALRAGIERIGRGQLDSPIPVTDRTELGLLADAINQMSGRLRRAQVDMLERARLSHEVDLARGIQRALLPARPAEAGPYLIVGDQRAAAEVGGDYYDVLSLSGGNVAVAVADVSGKGLAGCLVMSMLSVLLRAMRNEHASPSALLCALDARLGETLRPGTFVTMFYGIVDPAQRRLTFASAGHNPLLVYRHATGTVERLGDHGVPLAAVRGGTIRSTLRDQTVSLGPGDVAVQFTDGFSEARDATGGEPFGVERMVEQLTRAGEGGATAVLGALRGGLKAWVGEDPPFDDETLLVIGSPPEGARAAVSGDAHESSDTALALVYLDAAERRGSRLELEARLDAMPAIRAWLARVPILRDLGGEDAELLRAALHEACANIAEHGYDDATGKRFDLWWLPPEAAHDAAGTAAARDGGAADAVRHGWFVIRDDGKPFRPESWQSIDLREPGARRRGRGIGLDIIHRVMHEVLYQPATARGNITLMRSSPGAGIPRGEGIDR